MTQNSHPIVQLAHDGNFTSMEEKWIQAVESGLRDFDAFYRAADTTVASGRGDVAGPLLGMLLEALAKETADDERVAFAESAVLLCITDRGVRAAAAKVHERAGRPELGALLAPLDNSNSESARDRVMKCLRLKPGTFVAATSRLHPERVVRFDVAELLFVLSDLDDERALSPDQAAAELTILATDDFRALLRFETPRLVAMANDDPSALLMSALRAHRNRLEWQALKKLLARGIVDPTGFARWWNRSKGHFERNPMIQMYGERQPIIILRDRPISHEEELLSKLTLAPSPLEKFDVVLEYIASIGSGHALDGEFLKRCAEILAEIAESPASKPVHAIIAATILDDVRKLDSSITIDVDRASLAARAGDLGDLTPAIESEDFCRRALQFAREHMNDLWPVAYAKALPNAPGRLPDVIAKELLAAGRSEELAAAVNQILASPERYGEGLNWLWRAATSKLLDDAGFKVDKVAITMAVLRLMNRWARAAKSQVSAAQKSLLPRMRNALVGSNYKTILAVFDEVTDEQAVQLHHVLKDNLGLTDAQRHKLSEDLKSNHRDAIMGRKEIWEEDVIYTTGRGLHHRQDEFNKIVNVDMVANSTAIGEAAAFGDLSENAEFTSALEKRDFLAARANEIGDELKKARQIPHDLPTDRVNVGTRVTIRDVESGKEEVLTFLGPWDGNLDQRIYSYKAPFALAFLGKKVGEFTEDGDRRVEIVAIEKADIGN
jgi:transcription elongation factor GreA